MTTYVLLYEGFANFEIVLAMLLLKEKYEIKTFGITKDPLKSSEGLTVLPDLTIEEIKLGEGDVLLIPGGDPDNLYDQAKVYDLIKEADAKKNTIGAICAAPVHLAKAGILGDREYTTSLDPKAFKDFNPDMYVHENVVIDEHIITAKPSGYVDFAILLGQECDIYEDEDDFEETVDFFREFQF